LSSLCRGLPGGRVPRIASLEWDNAELKALHQALSDEMKREVAALVRLHDDAAEPARRTA
jgi:hypothetical protein